jgi:hypothetical protein
MSLLLGCGCSEGFEWVSSGVWIPVVAVLGFDYRRLSRELMQQLAEGGICFCTCLGAVHRGQA